MDHVTFFRGVKSLITSVKLPAGYVWSTCNLDNTNTSFSFWAIPTSNRRLPLCTFDFNFVSALGWQYDCDLPCGDFYGEFEDTDTLITEVKSHICEIPQ